MGKLVVFGTRSSGLVLSLHEPAYVLVSGLKVLRRSYITSTACHQKCDRQDGPGVGTEDVPIREVSSFQRVLCTGFNGVGTEDVPIREVSSFLRVLCTGFSGVGT